MPKIAYRNINFRGEALRIIDQAEAICRDYAAQGFDLTLRQLYYQFVARDLIANKDTEYKRLGGIINDARLAGYIDWDHVVDRTRNMQDNSHWSTPGSIIRSAARSYEIDKWSTQDNYVECWIEKDALVGVLAQVCPDNDVPYFSCRGYTSQSEIWGAAMRMHEKIQQGKQVVILHLGDHDPSGIDMTRDIEKRLRLFIGSEMGEFGPEDVSDDENVMWDTDLPITIDRIALNLDQVQTYNPPPNPAKLTDVRARKYIARFGPQSWELDALDPATLTRLIQVSIESYRDEDLWDEAKAKEEEQRVKLTQASERWSEIVEFLDRAS